MLSSGFAFTAMTRYPEQAQYGVWRSLVARVVRDDEVAGSNPVTPTEGERAEAGGFEPERVREGLTGAL